MPAPHHGKTLLTEKAMSGSSSCAMTAAMSSLAMPLSLDLRGTREAATSTWPEQPVGSKKHNASESTSLRCHSLQAGRKHCTCTCALHVTQSLPFPLPTRACCLYLSEHIKAVCHGMKNWGRSKALQLIQSQLHLLSLCTQREVERERGRERMRVCVSE